MSMIEHRYMSRISDIVRRKEFSDNVSYGKDNDTEPSRTKTNHCLESASAWRAERSTGSSRAQLYCQARLSSQSELSRARSGSYDARQSREKEPAAHQ